MAYIVLGVLSNIIQWHKFQLAFGFDARNLSSFKIGDVASSYGFTSRMIAMVYGIAQRKYISPVDLAFADRVKSKRARAREREKKFSEFVCEWMFFFAKQLLSMFGCWINLKTYYFIRLYLTSIHIFIYIQKSCHFPLSLCRLPNKYFLANKHKHTYSYITYYKQTVDRIVANQMISVRMKWANWMWWRKSDSLQQPHTHAPSDRVRIENKQKCLNIFFSVAAQSE